MSNILLFAFLALCFWAVATSFTIAIASLDRRSVPKNSIVAIGVFCFLLWLSFVAWSWKTYPDLTPQTVLVHDHGTIVNITPRGGRGTIMIETSSGTILDLYPKFPLHEGDSITYYVQFERSSADTYFLINGRKLSCAGFTWNGGAWDKVMKYYPAKEK